MGEKRSCPGGTRTLDTRIRNPSAEALNCSRRLQPASAKRLRLKPEAMIERSDGLLPVLGLDPLSDDVEGGDDD